jgi:hypothetical protein
MDSLTREFIDQIRTLKRRKPFVPYTIVRRNGQRHEITRPFQVAFNDVTIVIMPEDDSGSEFFKIEEISKVEIHETVS